MATAVRFPHFGPKVCVAPDQGKRAAYSSSAGLRKDCIRSKQTWLVSYAQLSRISGAAIRS